MGIKEFSHMEYLDGMEVIDSRIWIRFWRQ